jgi:serine phosphatase RsbU (regulator of sigma subunit)/pSer/pThr/pTyr-binding forkhead associated (FHA) protein
MPRIFVYPRKGNFFQLALEEKKISIGRSSTNDIVIEDPYSSNLHAFIYPAEAGYRLVDNDSKNGTFLNSRKIEEVMDLKKGDEILIGSTRIIFGKALSTNVEVTPEDTAKTNIETILSVKEVLEKTDISTSIRAKTREVDLGKIDREIRLLSVIKIVSQELLLHRPLYELLDKVMELVNESLPMDRGTLMLMDGNPPQLQPRSARINNNRLMKQSYKVSQNILNMVMDKHSSILISEVKDDSQLRKAKSIVIQKIHSAMCVPLWNEGEIIGVIYADRIFLPQPFSEEDLELMTLIANLAAVKIKDCMLTEERAQIQRIKKQLEFASQIQQSFLPQEHPRFGGFDIAGHNIPTYQVGGDYYDYIPLGSNRLGVTIADVSGKGPGAGLEMVSFRTRLEVEAVPGYDLQEMTVLLNNYVHRKTDVNRFISFFFCELDSLTGKLKYVNAGHNPPFVLRKTGEQEKLETCGLCLGMFPSQEYELKSIQLEPGDLTVLYTDGITDCRSDDKKEYGERRFMELIKENSGLSAAKLKDKVFEDLEAFSKGSEQMDDMTLVIVKRVGSKG